MLDAIENLARSGASEAAQQCSPSSRTSEQPSPPSAPDMAPSSSMPPLADMLQELGDLLSAQAGAHGPHLTGCRATVKKAR